MSKSVSLPKRKEVSDLTQLPSLATPSPKALLDPAELFLHLTAFTCPFGGEKLYYGKMLNDLGFTADAFGNWFLEIKNETAPTTCFMAHLDTADRDARRVTRVIEDGICKTDGKSILGADDRAGVTVLLYLAARDVPGLYYLFCGEECGCVGSGRAAKAETVPARYTKAVCFDRRGTKSLVTHQAGWRTCSDAFAEELCQQMNFWGFKYSPDPTGVYTDSKQFADQIPECTNLSVGYERAHSTGEAQDLTFLAQLCEAAAKVDWEGLPVQRDPNVVEADDYYSDLDAGWGYAYGGDYGRHEHGYYEGSGKTGYFGHGEQDNALAAMDEIVESFQLGLAFDRNAIRKLVMKSPNDTTDMIELLLEELQRHALWGNN